MTTTYPSDGVYRIEAALNADADGFFRVRVYKGAEILDTTFNTDRERAIEKAAKFVERWHRNHEPSVEVIEL